MNFSTWRLRIPQSVKDVGQKVRNLSRNRWLRLSIQIFIILLSLAYLASNFYSAKGLLSNLQINYLALACAWVLTTLCVFLGGLGWWLTLIGLGQSVEIAASLRVHLLSNLAKYIPGYAWQLVRKASLSHEMDLPPGVIGPGMLLELFQVAFTGLGIVVALIPDNLLNRWIGSQSILQIFPFLRAFLLLTMTIFLISLPFILRKHLVWRLHSQVKPFALWGATLTILTGWFLFGIAFWLIGIAIQQMSLSRLPLFTFALATSFLVGFAIIIVPGSIGVRESIMVLILGPIIGGPVAVLIATLSRLIITLSEVVCALGLEFVTYRLHSH